MKKMMSLLACIGAILWISGCQSTEMTSVPNGFIQSAELATEIGKIYLNRVYGAERVAEQEPFEVILEDDLWIINGKSKDGSYANPMQIILRRSSGAVISVAPPIDYNAVRRR